MKITTGLYPKITAYSTGLWNVTFREVGEGKPAQSVLTVTELPRVEIMTRSVLLYADEPEYNVERDLDARSYYNIPEDAQVIDTPFDTGVADIVREYHWYEVTA